MKNNYKSLNGYIEGYYGRLLTWEERYRIISRLNKNKMNFYFYAPKEDEKHRFNWKLKYDYKWTQNFITFCEIAKRNNIKVIIGISPGFTFNFKEVENKKSKDFKTYRELEALYEEVQDSKKRKHFEKEHRSKFWKKKKIFNESK